MSVLLPDVGGPYWSRRLRVHDLAGLCDRAIATRLGDRRALADHILGTLRPTFISFHDRHAWWSGLHDDPRFVQGYAPIETRVDGTIRAEFGRELLAGAFVRRDALRAAGIEAAALRRAPALPAPALGNPLPR